MSSEITEEPGPNCSGHGFAWEIDESLPSRWARSISFRTGRLSHSGLTIGELAICVAHHQYRAIAVGSTKNAILKKNLVVPRWLTRRGPGPERDAVAIAHRAESTVTDQCAACER